MKRISGNILLRMLVLSGVLLGAILLVQTILTYRIVANQLVQKEAEHEMRHQIAVLEKEVQSAQTRDGRKIMRIVEEVQSELPGQVAGLRILRQDGMPLAESGSIAQGLYSPALMRQAMEKHETLSKVVTIAGKRFLLTARPFHAEALPVEGATRAVQPPSAPLFVEMAVDLGTVAAPVGPLRISSMIGGSAAIALILAVIVIGLRFRQYLQGEQVQQQLEVARSVQADLLPAPGSTPDLDLAGVCKPALQVGGDFYDVRGSADGRTGLMLADVAGKGLPASLLSSLIQGALSGTSWMSGAEPHETATGQLNDFLCARSAQARFASLVWCYYTPATSSIQYINAGHLPPMIVSRRPKGATEVRRLDEAGPVLGLLPESRYRQGQAHIGAGDLLVMYSDGITEAENEHRQDFGEERLIEIVRKNFDRAPGEICDAVLKGIGVFLGDLDPQDDQTLVIVRLQPGARYRSLESSEPIEEEAISAVA